MQVKIAHILHPAIVASESDLMVAQPITFASMKVAHDFVMNHGDACVSMYAIQQVDEAGIALPECFERVEDLQRSIVDLKRFRTRRKMALIKDILDALYLVSVDSDYMVYTNVDIALQPHFYSAITTFIRQGYDAFVINRRTISNSYVSPAQLPEMYEELGEAHKGYDCFVFKREVYPKFKLGSICIGFAWVGRAILANMVSNADQFNEFRNEHLTFHVGDSCMWRSAEFSDYVDENRKEYESIFKQLENEHGQFDKLWRSYLCDVGLSRQMPDFN